MKVSLISRKNVENIVSMKEVMNAVENAFRAKGMGKVQMPLGRRSWTQRF